MTKVVNFVKRFWGYFATAVVVFFGVVILRRKLEDYEDLIKKLQDAHEEQIKNLNKIREEELAKYKENERKYQERMAIVEAEYEKAKQELDDKKRRRIEDLVKKYANKPDKLAEKLSSVTGLKIVLSEE